MVFNADIRNNFIQYGQSLQSLKLLTGDLNGQTELLALTVQNLTPKQQALALATKGVSQAQIAEVLQINELSNAEVTEALSTSALITQKKKLTVENAKQAIMAQGLAESTAEQIMYSAGIVSSDKAQVLSKKEVSVATLEAKLAQEGLSVAQIKAITTQLGLGTSTLTLSNYFKGLAVSTWASVKAIGAFLVTNPVGWCILAAGAIAGVTASIVTYNKKQQELREEAEESANAYNNQAEAMKDLTSQYEAILDSNKTDIEKTQELNKWKNTLIETYKFEEEQLRNLNLEREKGLALLEAEIEANNRKSRNKYLDDYKEQYEEAKRVLDKSGDLTYDNLFNPISGLSDIGKDIQQLFDINSTLNVNDNLSERTLGINYEDRYDALEKLKSIYNDILEISRNRKLTNEELGLKNFLDDKIDLLEKEIETYGGVFESYEKFDAINTFQDYIKTNGKDIKNVGKETFLEWKNGLLAQASSTQMKRELEKLIEEQMPDLNNYFDNLSKARQKFIQASFSNANEAAWAKEKDNFLSSLSPEDLEASLNIPDLFADGLDGATAKIEAWKADPKNKITPDVEVDDTEISAMLETVSKKVKLITTAMEEQADTGYISSSTYAEIIEMGGNFADCLEVQDGKLRLNIEKLKDLEKQELRNELAEIRLTKASWETVKATKAMGGEDTSAVDEKIRELTRQEAVINQAISEITNAKPDDKKTKEEKPQSVLDFEAEYARRQHEISMGRMKEDEDYYKWLESAAKTAFEGLADYEDDLWKYQEEVYKGRKQLAEDFYDSQRDYYKDRVSDLEAQIEITTKDSTDNNGNLLNAEEKFAYIRSVYSDILATIQEDINDIVQNGIEGHEDDLKELEQQYEKYVREMADIFKDEVESEIDYIHDLQDTAEKAFDDKIDKIEAEKKAMEDRYDAEINKIDDIIDSLEKENDQKQLALNIAKAEKELAEAQRKRNVGVLQANGTISYQADPEAITNAQNNLNELYLKRTTEALEQQKEIFQKNKEIESDNYDAKINNLNADKDKWKDFYDDLVQTLNEYLNPKQKESNSNVWNTVAGEDGAVKVGKVEMSTDQIDARIGSEDIAKSLIEKLIKASNDEVKAKELVKNLDLNNAYNALWGNSLRPVGLAELQKAGMFNNVSTQNYVNNNGQTVNLSIGDITITNPVGNSKNLAEELMKKLPNAMLQQIYKVR